VSKQASALLSSGRFKFDERQLGYIRRSHRDAVKAGYIPADGALVVQKASRVWDDKDKADLFLPDGNYWDTIPE
jgi:hypothetical protein